MKVSFVYISLSGNTESFVRRLSDYLLEAHPGLEIEKVDRHYEAYFATHLADVKRQLNITAKNNNSYALAA